ncbi:hypothetical protein HGM15179_000160 [Zosterops borbonicus]|uniref:Uncharacterized protein n=1 Tax=Zosterops borbonicus TaxID=364589 RepID=A0A8K1H0C9_9PASS|nr:hypothetical protein HGM15179_000160 [Zosterops borbonicus]
MLKDPLGALVLSMTQEQIQRWTQVSAATGSEVAVALHSLGKQSRRQLLGYSSNIVREEGTEIYLKPEADLGRLCDSAQPAHAEKRRQLLQNTGILNTVLMFASRSTTEVRFSKDVILLGQHERAPLSLILTNCNCAQHVKTGYPELDPPWDHLLLLGHWKDCPQQKSASIYKWFKMRQHELCASLLLPDEKVLVVYQVRIDEISFPELSLLQAEQFQLSQALVTGEVLQDNSDLSGPPLDCLQYDHASLALGSPEPDKAFQERLHHH